MHGKRIFVLIPARGGSKGVPRKALKNLGGKPLIAWTIEHALTIDPLAKVHVNTDDPEIREVAMAFGAEVPFLRPAELAGDDSDLVDAVKHAVFWYWEHENYACDISIIMSPTYPFRRPGRVRNALRQGMDNPGIFNIGSAGPAHVDPFNYWTGTDEGYRRFRIPRIGEVKPEHLIQSCLSFNIVFEFRENNRLRTPVIVDEIEAIDIDEPEDLDLARAVVAKGIFTFGDHAP